MLTEPTDDELTKLIDLYEWLISKRIGKTEELAVAYTRKLEVQLFCYRATREALRIMRARQQQGGTPENKNDHA
jgi:hypothetical protein